MPRDLPLGNGSFLVNFDNSYHLRDIYYPHIGQDNQTDGHVNHTGIWLGGRFAWLDDAGWERTLVYEPGTIVTAVSMHHPDLGVTLHFSDAVDFDRPIFMRQVTVTNHGDQQREARLFFHYDWHIDEVSGGNTVYYDPSHCALVAYKKNRYFLGSGSVGDQIGIASWATGYKEINGMQGTWRDAEDGELGRNPIAQGEVDGTLALHLGMIGSEATATAFHWLVAGRTFPEVRDLHKMIVARQPSTFIERTRNYWKLWVAKGQENFGDLPQPIVDQYKRSLLTVATQMDGDGAIIAATDGDIWATSGDSYAYMWPRDGALVANALSHSGYGEPTRGFFNFCAKVISEKGYLLHKFTPSGALGSSWHPWADSAGNKQLPIQEDETALVVYSLWQHFSIFREVEFIKPLYAPLIKSAADFMVEFREPHTNLPAESYDLWEERRGINAYTVGAVYAGLKAAANFADAFGEAAHAARYLAAAEEIRVATRAHLWDEDAKRFVRRLNVDAQGNITRDMTMDMAITALYQFGMMPANDPQMEQTMQALLARLHVNTEVGGYARYEDDYYHQVSHDLAHVPGNPWFICSCWAAQYHISRAQNDADLHAALPLLQWVVNHALPSGILAEQVDPYTNAPLSASPLTWSHAEFIATVRWYVGKHQRLSLAGVPHDHPVAQAAQATLNAHGGSLPGEPHLG